MDISTSITQAQADALAQLLNIASYADGNDLIQQVAAYALLQTSRIALVQSIAVCTDQPTLDAVSVSYGTTSGTPITPIKTRQGAGGTLAGGGAVKIG